MTTDSPDYDTAFDACEAQLHAAAIRAMREEAARIKAKICADRGLPPSSGCKCRADVPAGCGDTHCDSGQPDAS